MHKPYEKTDVKKGKWMKDPKAIQITVPKGVEYIIRQIEQAGYEAYAVGGCVRDALLGREPEDWDITTSAKPEVVKSLFLRTIDTGIEHGTVTVLLSAREAGGGDRAFEVTTYRVDGIYEDGRHPKAVSFTGSLEEDLARRDFTINAMAYHMDRGIIDCYHGQEDLENKRIRTVGRAEERFTEDALRMMRGIRFSAQLDFQIEEDCLQAMLALRENLGKVSKERIAVELVKLLCSKHPERVKLLFSTGLSDFVTRHFSEIEKRGIPYLLGNAKDKKYLRLGLLLRHVPELAKGILEELKLDRECIDKAGDFVELFSLEETDSPYALRKRLFQYGLELTQDFYETKLLLLENVSNTPGKEMLEQTELRLEWLQKILEDGDCYHMSDLAISGRDLLAVGVQAGPVMGEILHFALDYVMRNPGENKKGILLSLVKNRFVNN